MNLKKFYFILSLALLSFIGSCKAEPNIYVFTDFGGVGNNKNQPISDWQTAIELACQGWKLTQHPHIFINDGAAPLDPAKACAQLATAFPYLGADKLTSIKRIVVHVIDPGVGNASKHPRALVLRKDGTLFIGPDNGTLSLICPQGSIDAIWEINIKQLATLTGIDLETGGTFHGRDVFITAAYLIASNKVVPADIGNAYAEPQLQFRIESLPEHTSLQFERLTTTRWNIKLNKSISNDEIFAHAYFLGIVQSPFYTGEKSPQLFLIEDQDQNDHIAIFNKKTGNLYIGPNNGIGTSFFQDFLSEDVLTVAIGTNAYRKIYECEDVNEVLRLVHQQTPLEESLIAIDLLAHVVAESSSNHEQIIKGRIWLDAYGNIKTTLDSELLSTLQKASYKNLVVELNGLTRSVQFANSFAEVPAGEAFIYIGSSGTIGPNPKRSRRYIELTCNGSEGVFGIDLFTNGTNRPYNGEEIVFRFTK